MKRVSFTVFLIWAMVYFAVWYSFDLLGLANREFFSIFTFPVDTRLITTFVLQIGVVGGYFVYFQKENLKDGILRSFIFNFLIYLVYILLYLRAQGI